MTPDPKQLAREMAEKCAEIILRTASHFFPRSSMTEIILRELNLEQLIADKQRLEKLESMRTFDASDPHFSILHFRWLSFSNSFRQAIDKAIQENP